MPLVTIPTFLTLFRIAAIPVVIGLFFWKSPLSSWFASILFLIACITDFLDGYVARALKQVTHFGGFLDPLADKLLVASCLLMLAGSGAVHGLHLIPACVILCREIIVSGLREFLAETQVSMPVTPLAKWKTALQMMAIGFLILGNPFPEVVDLPTISLGGLWVAALLTVITAYEYVRHNFHHLWDKKS
jgi:cardiolipin synthase